MIKLQKILLFLIINVSINVVALADSNVTEGKKAVKVRGGYVSWVHKNYTNHVQSTFENTVFESINNNKVNINLDNCSIAEIVASYFITDNIGVEGSVGYSNPIIFVKQNNIVDEFSRYEFNRYEYSSSEERLNVHSKTVTVVPVTVLVQYHFSPDASFSPYVGVGYSYRFISKGPKNVNLKDAGSIVGQVGLDIPYNDSIAFNIDVKYTHRPSSDKKIKNTEIFTKDSMQFIENKISKINLSSTAVTTGLTFRF